MIKITIETDTNNKAYYNTWLANESRNKFELIGRYKEPLLSVARELLNKGANPEETLGLTRDGCKVDMSGKIGKLAKLTVIENQKEGPRFGQYKSYPELAHA